MAVRWSRVELYLSVLTCKGLWSTLRERFQYAPAGAGARPDDVLTEPGEEHSLGLPRFYDYAGAVHVHSTYSDGAGTVAEIAQAANESGLDFVVMCDHSNLDALRDGQGGWRGRTLFVIGTEVTTQAGHLLALNVPDSFLPAPDEPRAAQEQIAALGGIGFIALPCDLKDHWRDFTVRDRRMGLEVFNLSAIARTKINLLALALVWIRYRCGKPQKAFHWIAARPSRELRLWDQLICEPLRHGGNKARYDVVVGIGSIDAHGIMKFGGRAYRLPTYADVFRTLRTHILLMEPLAGIPSEQESDLQRVHAAMGRGHSYIAYDNYADSTGFLFECVTDAGRAVMGDSVFAPSEGRPAFRLVARAPKTRSFLRLFRDGKLVAAARGGYLEYITSRPGAYRVEAFLFRYRVGDLCLGAKPWIFSNPIYIQPIEVNAHPDNVGSAAADRSR